MTATTAAASKLVSQEEINQAYRDYSPKFGGKKEEYFGVVYISKRFQIPLSEAAPYVALGGSPYGVDGFYYDSSSGSLYLFAFRWSADHMSFKESLEKLGREGMYKIFFDPTKSESDGVMMTALKTLLHRNWKSIEKVYVDFVFNGDPVDAEQSKVLSFLREAVEDKKTYVDSYLSQIGQQDRVHDLVFNYISNEKSLGHVASSRESMEYTIDFGESLRISGKDNEMMVVFAPLGALYRMYSDLGERFFEKNIRSGLDDGNMTNYQIKRSLRRVVEGKELPENFTLYHNGITMTAQLLVEDEQKKGTVRMVEPRILNGAQTIKILKQFVDEFSSRGRNDGDSGNSSDRSSLLQKLAETRVMARIIRSRDEEFLKTVTINNNRQNPIMPWNLRANDLVQVGFEELFAKLGIYYERRENAYKNLSDDDLEAIGTEKGVIEIRKFAQTLLALQGQIDRISEMREVFEDDAWYADTFKERYLSLDPRKLVLMYKVQFRLPSVIREIRSVGNEKYSYAGRAKNLLWCLALQGILNDAKFEKYLDYYGSSTAPEAGITELLKSMATTKLRFILSDTLEGKKYKDYLEESRFSFLRTRAVLNECMDAAASRFKWERKSL